MNINLPIMLRSQGRPKLTFIGSNGAINGASSSNTFTNQGIGTAAADRMVIVAIGVNQGGTSISSVTIGGIAATIVAIKNDGISGATSAFAYLVVPSGTTATIVVTANGTISELGIAVYTLTNRQGAAPSGNVTALGTTAAVSLSITPTAQDVLLCVSCHIVNSGTITAVALTNITKDAQHLSTNHVEAFGSNAAPTAGAVTLTSTETSGTTPRAVMSAITWR